MVKEYIKGVDIKHKTSTGERAVPIIPSESINTRKENRSGNIFKLPHQARNSFFFGRFIKRYMFTE